MNDVVAQKLPILAEFRGCARVELCFELRMEIEGQKARRRIHDAMTH